MKHRIAICGLGLMALGVATATSAGAQGYYYGPPRVYGAPPPMYDAGIPEGEVLMLVRAQGLTPLTRPARRGPRYVLLASDRMGGQLRVVVSAFDGRILRVAPAHDPRFAYQPARPHALVPVPRHGAPPPPARYGAIPGPEVKDPPDARAPRQVAPRQAAPRQAAPPPVAGTPNDQQLASAPATTELPPRRPARTPLPRPRPATASNETAPSAPAQAAAEAGTPPPPPAARPQQPASPAPTTGQGKTPAPMVPVAPLE